MSPLIIYTQNRGIYNLPIEPFVISCLFGAKRGHPNTSDINGKPKMFSI